MAQPKLGQSSQGKPMHYSVGAVIQREEKYLLLDRMHSPFGFAGVAGHVDEGESDIEALLREVREESGLTVVKYNLLFREEVDGNTCKRGITVHYWHLFQCNTRGAVKRNIQETKSIGWYTSEEIKQLILEPVWNYWFTKLNVI